VILIGVVWGCREPLLSNESSSRSGLISQTRKGGSGVGGNTGDGFMFRALTGGVAIACRMDDSFNDEDLDDGCKGGNAAGALEPLGEPTACTRS
jgi:hypothetical protein